jgi:hypothetical protein
MWFSEGHWVSKKCKYKQWNEHGFKVFGIPEVNPTFDNMVLEDNNI